MPEEGLAEALENYTTVSFDDSILNLALHGPTKDLEDNIQLYSAEKADCDLFLTFNKDLLKMKSFGGMKIVDHIHKTERG